MRFLGIGGYCDLGALYSRLLAAGHEVRVYIEEEASHEIFSGMLERTADWHAELPWIRAAGADGVIIFESAVMGGIQDALRHDGYHVIGGSGLGDRLEGDRQFAQQILHDIGLPIARSHHFTDFATAIEFVRRTRCRYVLKNNRADSLRTSSYIGEMADGADMIALLKLRRGQGHGPEHPNFLLMDHLEGVEIGVGAYFNGTEFLKPACLDWEHKRLFPGDLGELTGEMGTIVTYDGAERIFDATLARVVTPLRASGYCGYLNLNLIANEQGLWPLEFTSRFGYPGFAICDALQRDSWDCLFRKMLHGGAPKIATRAGYGAGIVLTVPPFPYEQGYDELSKGVSISFREPLTQADHDHLFLGEVAMQDGQLVTSGTIGYLGVATGVGTSIAQAREKAYALARKVVVPNLRYRTDIGDRLIANDLGRLRRLGYVG